MYARRAHATHSRVCPWKWSDTLVPWLARTGWDRDFVDKTNDESDPYDKGAPDYQTGDKKDLKWRIICAGVERLVQEKGLRAEDVLLWCDWQVSVLPEDTRALPSPGR